jgi:hypothetical protein
MELEQARPVGLAPCTPDSSYASTVWGCTVRGNNDGGRLIDRPVG